MEHWDPSTWTAIGRGRIGLLDLAPLGLVALAIAVVLGLGLL